MTLCGDRFKGSGIHIYNTYIDAALQCWKRGFITGECAWDVVKAAMSSVSVVKWASPLQARRRRQVSTSTRWPESPWLALSAS